MSKPSVLIIGASRGLGWGLAREYLRRGWQVAATVRDPARHRLGELQEQAGGALRIEQVDITQAETIDALRERLDRHRFEVLFVNAGVTNAPEAPVDAVSDEEFACVMLTNALGPLRVIERLDALVAPDGQVAAMSSELGSIANNHSGGWEVYRASKAALNMLMRSLVARRQDGRSYCVVAPGWVRTDMGGPEAPLDVETSIPGVVDALARRAGTAGLAFVNYRGEVLPW